MASVVIPFMKLVELNNLTLNASLNLAQTASATNSETTNCGASDSKACCKTEQNNTNNYHMLFHTRNS